MPVTSFLTTATFTHPFGYSFPLELGDRRKDREEEFAGAVVTDGLGAAIDQDQADPALRLVIAEDEIACPPAVQNQRALQPCQLPCTRDLHRSHAAS
jgi:hypothetical protein